MHYNLPAMAPAMGALLLLAGCSTHRYVANNAFDDLVNETRSTDTRFIKYKSYVAVSGLIPHAAPGTIFHHPEGLSPTHGLPLSPKYSYVVESRFQMEKGGTADGQKKVNAIRDKYVEARQAIVKATALGAKAGIAGRVVELTRTTKDLEQCKLAAHVLAMSAPARCDQPQIDALGVELTKAENAAAQAAGDAATKRQELAKSLDGNVIITRWDQRTELTWLGKLAEVFALTVDRKQDLGGVLIAGDLRTWSQRVGEDYVDMVREMDPTARTLFQETQIDLFMVEARHRAYAAELKLEDAVAASLSLSVEQLRQWESLLKAADRVDLRMGAALLTDISNMGVLGAPVLHAVRRRCFMPPAENERAAQREFLVREGYHTLYQVRAQITSMDALAKIKTDLSMQLAGKNEEEKEKIIRNYRACQSAPIPKPPAETKR